MHSSQKPHRIFFVRVDHSTCGGGGEPHLEAFSLHGGAAEGVVVVLLGHGLHELPHLLLPLQRSHTRRDGGRHWGGKARPQVSPNRMAFKRTIIQMRNAKTKKMKELIYRCRYAFLIKKLWHTILSPDFKVNTNRNTANKIGRASCRERV